MDQRVKIKPTHINDLKIVESDVHSDTRGTFTRLFCEQELLQNLEHRRIVQINQSCTNALGAVRGLHFQLLPNAEMKLVRCLKGKVWDVAVDLRPDSSTYLQWHAEVLSPTNALMMLIPEGFAHGFQVLEAGSELLYLHTASYSPGSERGLRYDDPRLKISWPIKVTDLSLRDACHPLIDVSFQGVIL